MPALAQVVGDGGSGQKIVGYLGYNLTSGVDLSLLTSGVWSNAMATGNARTLTRHLPSSA